MLAIPERVSGRGGTPDQTIWHKPIGRVVEEFQAIACGEEEGVTMPWAKVEVPLRLTKEHEQWCPDCLAIIRTEQ
ncbi:hypothetical protein ACIPMU_38735 [Streptomyces cyaneofuscatus]|uniref:hypothetical protein n=1 Tax=Streptomyces cyaneofuscatus TaxID=66883 RepID=UPI00381C652E